MLLDNSNWSHNFSENCPVNDFLCSTRIYPKNSYSREKTPDLWCVLRTAQKARSVEQHGINILRSLNAASEGILEGKSKITHSLWAADNCVEVKKAGKCGNAEECVCEHPYSEFVFIGEEVYSHSIRNFASLINLGLKIDHKTWTNPIVTIQSSSRGFSFMLKINLCRLEYIVWARMFSALNNHWNIVIQSGHCYKKISLVLSIFFYPSVQKLDLIFQLAWIIHFPSCSPHSFW